jgi:hypothetical protein
MEMSIEGGQPDLFKALISDFVDIDWKSRSALSLGEQLYTAKGSQSVAVGSYVT